MDDLLINAAFGIVGPIIDRGDTLDDYIEETADLYRAAAGFLENLFLAEANYIADEFVADAGLAELVDLDFDDDEDLD